MNLWFLKDIEIDRRRDIGVVVGRYVVIMCASLVLFVETVARLVAMSIAVIGIWVFNCFFFV